MRRNTRRKVTEKKIAVGNPVYLFIAVKIGRTKKLVSFWRRPYTEIDRTSPIYYHIRCMLVHHSGRLKIP